MTMSDAFISENPLRTTFKIKLNGKTVAIATQAYQFLTNLSLIEWMEFRSLRVDAIRGLRAPPMMRC